MPTAPANALEIDYDTFGDPAGRPLLLIMGLGAQKLLWEEEFCAALADSGHYVIRYDNRDVGLSTKMDGAGIPDISLLLAGLPVQVPYTLDDMADDAAALLTALGFASAHICGASMGGMIAQVLAYRHPSRLRSLTSIMSTTGNPSLPPPTPEALTALLTPPPADRDGYVERSVATWRVISSPGFPFDEELTRRRAERLYDRCFYPEGVARQLAAIIAGGSRVERLRGVTAPTLVIHGDADPLVPIEGGRDTAAAVPGAKLLIIEGMGHDLPRDAWPRLVEAIEAHTAQAERA
ncbi:MAG: alpha/beta fold hydrolase [Candidatus Binatia bacterium]